MINLKVGLIVIAAAVLAACSGTAAQTPARQTDTPAPRGVTASTPITARDATPSKPASSGGQVLFQDDFASTSSGWKTLKGDYGQFEYKDGAYHIFLEKADLNGFSLLPGSKFDNVTVEADVRLASGPSNVLVGLFCRAAASETALNTAYEFFIRADGQFAILKRTSATFHDVVKSGGDSKAVRTGNATNHLRADCSGDALALWVNGERLLTTTDRAFTAGQVGMGVTTQPDHGQADVYFDNFAVRAATP